MVLPSKKKEKKGRKQEKGNELPSGKEKKKNKGNLNNVHMDIFVN